MLVVRVVRDWACVGVTAPTARRHAEQQRERDDVAVPAGKHQGRRIRRACAVREVEAVDAARVAVTAGVQGRAVRYGRVRRAGVERPPSDERQLVDVICERDREHHRQRQRSRRQAGRH